MKIAMFSAGVMLVLLAGCASKHPAAPQTARAHYPYTKPLTSPGGKFGALPPAVQNTVRAEAGMAEVVDAVRDTRSGHVVYIIYFKEAGTYPPLYIAPDGSVLYPDLTLAVAALSGTIVKPENLPLKVLKVIQDRAPGAELASINKELWGSRVVYIFAFKDPTRYPKLDIASDGTILEEISD